MDIIFNIKYKYILCNESHFSSGHQIILKLSLFKNRILDKEKYYLQVIEVEFK